MVMASRAAALGTLLRPRQVRLFLVLLLIGVAAGARLMRTSGLPLWSVTVLVLTLLAVPTIQTWHDYGRR